MADHQFEDASLAALYDTFCAWDRRDDFDFYLPLVMDADAVLDVGCGTGMLLKRARGEGHAGRLVGIDPAFGMLEVARSRTDIEWIHGTDISFEQEFDLVVMTGHAFQVLLTDEEVRDALAAIRRALRSGGRFAFETRNPLVRTWEQWDTEAVDGVRMSHIVTAVDGEYVTFETTFTGGDWTDVSRSTLRFLSQDALVAFLDETGFTVAEQYGNWDRTPFMPTSPEIITIAVRR